MRCRDAPYQNNHATISHSGALPLPLQPPQPVGFAKQYSERSCPRHSKWAGHAALKQLTVQTASRHVELVQSLSALHVDPIAPGDGSG